MITRISKTIIKSRKHLLANILLGLGLTLSVVSCASYDKFKQVTEEMEIPSQVYKADYNKVWQEVMKITNKYPRELFNQEAGVIKTRWNDNTLELNFSDSFGSNDSVKAAEFKLIINVVKGYRGTKEVTKVSIYKRQRVEQDFLQGWKLIPSDGILEKSMLYRLDRALAIEERLQKIEDQKTKEAESKF